MKIILEKRAQKFLARLPVKQGRQAKDKLFALLADPFPPDSKKLKGSAFRGVDFGEYRIIYSVASDTLYIPIVGKRNDDEVYRKLKQLES